MDSIHTTAFITVPVSLLTTSELPPTAKVLWMVLSLDKHLDPATRLSPSRLSRMVGFARSTIRHAIDSLTILCWYSPVTHAKLPKLAGDMVTIPRDLVFDDALSRQAKVLYGVLQGFARLINLVKQFRYSLLSRELDLDVKTVRKCSMQLIRRGWLKVQQANRLAPITFVFRNPIHEMVKSLKAQLSRLFSQSQYTGEALMKGFLSVIVDTDAFIDNARPAYLVNPNTGQLLELDRYFFNANVAFEFNGTQHYRSSEKYGNDVVTNQRQRDEVKRNICLARGIELITIQGNDLTFSTMLERVKGLLPLRNHHGLDQVIDTLEKRSAAYRAKTPVIEIK